MPEIISRVDLPPGSLEPEFAIRRGSFGDFQAFVKDATFRMAMGGPTLPPMVRPPGTPRRQLSTSAPPARPARVVHAAPLPGVIAAAAAAAAAADANSQETVASLLASCRLSQVRDAECEGEGERLGGECWQKGNSRLQCGAWALRLAESSPWPLWCSTRRQWRRRATCWRRTFSPRTRARCGHCSGRCCLSARSRAASSPRSHRDGRPAGLRVLITNRWRRRVGAGVATIMGRHRWCRGHRRHHQEARA